MILANEKQLSKVLNISDRRVRELFKDYKSENGSYPFVKCVTEFINQTRNGDINLVTQKTLAEILGLSEKTKAANIERSPKVATKITELREILFQDTELGILSIATRLNKILNSAIEGVDIIEYIDESSPDGHTVSKRVRKDKPLLAGVAAARELNSMLGYRATDEAKLKAMINSENDTTVSDEDFE